jgi:hypothetical protein
MLFKMFGSVHKENKAPVYKNQGIWILLIVTAGQRKSQQEFCDAYLLMSVLCVVVTCGVLGGYKRSGETYCLPRPTSPHGFATQRPTSSFSPLRKRTSGFSTALKKSFNRY